MPSIVLRKTVPEEFRYSPPLAKEAPCRPKRKFKLPLSALRLKLTPGKMGRHADAIRQLLDDGQTDLAEITASVGHKAPSRVKYDLRQLFSRYVGITHKGDVYSAKEGEEGEES